MGIVLIAALVAYVPFLIWKVRVVRPKTFVSHLHPETIRTAFEAKVATTGWKIIDAGNPMIAQSPLLGGIRQQVALLLEPHAQGVEGSYETIRYVKKVLSGVPTKGVTLGLRKSAFFKELKKLEAGSPQLTAPPVEPMPGPAPHGDVPHGDVPHGDVPSGHVPPGEVPVMPTAPSGRPTPVVEAPPPPTIGQPPTIGPPPGTPDVPSPARPVVESPDPAHMSEPATTPVEQVPLDGFDEDDSDLTVKRDVSVDHLITSTPTQVTPPEPITEQAETEASEDVAEPATSAIDPSVDSPSPESRSPEPVVPPPSRSPESAVAVPAASSESPAASPEESAVEPVQQSEQPLPADQPWYAAHGATNSAAASPTVDGGATSTPDTKGSESVEESSDEPVSAWWKD